MRLFAAVAMLTLALSACTTMRPVFGPIAYDPARMEIVGVATATVNRMYILGVGPSGGKTTIAQEAVDAAAKEVGADTLINIVADDQKTYVLPFVYTHTLTVKGLGIRYKK